MTLGYKFHFHEQPEHELFFAKNLLIDFRIQGNGYSHLPPSQANIYACTPAIREQTNDFDQTKNASEISLRVSHMEIEWATDVFKCSPMHVSHLIFHAHMSRPCMSVWLVHILHPFVCFFAPFEACTKHEWGSHSFDLLF